MFIQSGIILKSNNGIRPLMEISSGCTGSKSNMIYAKFNMFLIFRQHWNLQYKY